MKDAKTLRQILWYPIKPVFPLLRNIFVRVGLVTPPDNGRHRFPFGFLKDGFSATEFRVLLKGRGFYIQPMAFIDPDQKLSLRKLDQENPHFQYHLRLYEDGEIRGHYEKTPEDHPLDHLREIGFEPKHPDFLKMLSGVLDESRVINLSDLSTPETPGHKVHQPYHELVREAEKGGDR